MTATLEEAAMAANKYADPARTTRRWITVGLVVGGALVGAGLGVALTPLGKIVAGAPPADAANFLRNALAFGVLGACIGPVVTWSALRNVPLWLPAVWRSFTGRETSPSAVSSETSPERI